MTDLEIEFATRQPRSWVLFEILRQTNGSNTFKVNRQAFAGKFNTSTWTIARCIEKLMKGGWLEMVERKRGPNNYSVYRVVSK